MNPTAFTALILQLHFATEEVLTVRDVHGVTLSDEKFDGDPYRFFGNGIIVSRSALRSIRVLSESDLIDQDLPPDIQFSRRAITRAG